MKLLNGQFCMGIKEVRAVFFFLDVRFLTCLMHIHGNLVATILFTSYLKSSLKKVKLLVTECFN